jgi:hypothetical protein
MSFFSHCHVKYLTELCHNDIIRLVDVFPFAIYVVMRVSFFRRSMVAVGRIAAMSSKSKIIRSCEFVAPAVLSVARSPADSPASMTMLGSILRLEHCMQLKGSVS